MSAYRASGVVLLQISRSPTALRVSEASGGKADVTILECGIRRIYPSIGHQEGKP